MQPIVINVRAGCFLVWMIVTTNAGPVYRDPAVAIANCVNATLLLIFIPLRKLHLLYMSKNEKPEVYASKSLTMACMTAFCSCVNVAK